MLVPCMVKSRLNVSGGTMCSPGHASCRRISVASIPATTKKTSPETTYMMPRRLWSTVTTQSWACSSHGRRAAASGLIKVGESTLTTSSCRHRSVRR